ncbi:MAG: urease accessory protein UreD [Acidimicrobiales bacterium]
MTLIGPRLPGSAIPGPESGQVGDLDPGGRVSEGSGCDGRLDGGLDGRVRLRIRRSDHPLGRIAGLMHTGSLAVRVTPWGAWLVGTAAGPIGGDRLSVDLEVDDGGRLEIRSPAATLARSGPDSLPSSMAVRVRLGTDTVLWWHPEPGIAGRGADHRSTVRIALAEGARVVWLEELVLGRHNERPGSWQTDLRIEDRGGLPIVVSNLVAGAGASSSGRSVALGDARAVSMLTVVDPTVARERWRAVTDRNIDDGTRRGAVGGGFPLAGPGLQLVVWGAALGDCRRLMVRLAKTGGVPMDVVTRVLAAR